MFPADELNRLARVKAVRRRHIGIHRARCVEAATGIARPLAWIDVAKTLWHRVAPLAPLAALPLALVFRGRPGLSRARGLLSWGPLAFTVARRLWSVSRPSTPPSVP